MFIFITVDTITMNTQHMVNYCKSVSKINVNCKNEIELTIATLTTKYSNITVDASYILLRNMYEVTTIG